nr:hypothetical protein CFP56_04529 [Quercus suber]
MATSEAADRSHGRRRNSNPAPVESYSHRQATSPTGDEVAVRRRRSRRWVSVSIRPRAHRIRPVRIRIQRRCDWRACRLSRGRPARSCAASRGNSCVKAGWASDLQLRLLQPPTLPAMR